MRAFLPAAAVLTLGLAVYFTNSALDQVVVSGLPVRVAMLPGWQVLVAFVAMAALGVGWLGRRSKPRTVTSAPIRLRIGPLTLPAFALALLVVPYLPFLPDWLPALQMPAGPLIWIVWLTVAGLFAWTLWQSRILHADWLERRSLVQVTVLIGVLTAAAAGLAASRLASTPVFPSGDEPHYLVMAQSLWRDGDLRIENNHANRDYREYYTHDDLKPDYLTRGADGAIYSIHPIGMPLLMAPVYGMGGYPAVVVALIVIAAIAAAQMWRSVVEATGSPGAATFAWAAIVMTAPFLFNAFAVYPEIVAALAVVIAFTRIIDPEAWPRSRVAHWLVVSLACASLPWLSTKYAPMSAVLVLIALVRVFAPAPPAAPGTTTSAPSHARTLAPAAALVFPYALSLAGWFGFFYAFWGTPLPQAPYGDLVQTDLRNVIFGAPGLLFDQEYGVLAYAPVYILAATGLVAMWRAGGETRRRAIETTLVFAALLGTVGAFRIWWGGTASPGRPLASGLLLLALPIAIAARLAPQGTARRAGHLVLLLVSVGVALTLLFAQQGLLINNGRDGTSTILEYWSPRWGAWSLAPTFIFHEAPTAWLHSLVWLAVAFAAAFALSRWRTRSAGGAALVAVGTFVASLVVLALVMPRLPQHPPLPEANLLARPRLPILDHFDGTARPIGVRYDPLHVDAASAILPLGTVSVEPGLRSDPQPIRVLHNGRFSLPAGRYRVDVAWAGSLSDAVPLGLQVGRIEPVWRTWSVQPQRGMHWESEFDLPVDASFVGFRGTPDLERAIGQLTVRPLAVVDEGMRPHVPAVLSVFQYGPATALFHDEVASPESSGFWVMGRKTARVTVVRDVDTAPLVLRVHSGQEPNKVTISMRGWEETLELHARAPQDMTLPDSHRRIVTFDVNPEDGFNPREYDPASQDPRFLGAWVEIVK